MCVERKKERKKARDLKMGVTFTLRAQHARREKTQKRCDKKKTEKKKERGLKLCCENSAQHTHDTTRERERERESIGRKQS